MFVGLFPEMLLMLFLDLGAGYIPKAIHAFQNAGLIIIQMGKSSRSEATFY